MTVRRAVWPLAVSIVVAGVLLLAVLPTRTWLDQRDRIEREEAKLQVLTEENQRLTARVQELHTDAEIERLAREQYNLVKPGEDAYAILPAPRPPEEEQPPPPPPDEDDDRSLLAKVGDVVTFWD